MCVDPKGGRAAVTHWSVLGRYPGHTHIQCRLETGQCLHARRLSFVHPSAGTRVTVECPLPDYFSQALRKLAR